MKKNFFGDEIYKDGVVVMGDDFVIYTSHEGYNELMKEVFETLKNELKDQIKFENNGNTNNQRDSKG